MESKKEYFFTYKAKKEVKREHSLRDALGLHNINPQNFERFETLKKIEKKYQ